MRPRSPCNGERRTKKSKTQVASENAGDVARMTVVQRHNATVLAGVTFATLVVTAAAGPDDAADDSADDLSTSTVPTNPPGHMTTVHTAASKYVRADDLRDPDCEACEATVTDVLDCVLLEHAWGPRASWDLKPQK